MEPTETPVGSPAEEHVPLGKLLVDAGLLTATDLDKVLDDQRRSGGLLGRLLVEGGYVAPTTVALALADQHGGLVKTEYGFATGRLPHRRANDTPLRLVEEQDDIARELELAQDARRALNERRVELEAALRNESAARIQAVTALRNAEATIAELRARLAPPPPVVHASHHLYVPRADGYDLVTRDGEPPAVDSMLERDGETYRVLRVGPSPFVDDDALCAFLERATEPPFHDA